MATRKQRSRRAKSFRHDYGFVMDDEEGNEVQLTGAEVRGKKDVAESAKPQKGKQSSGASKAAPRKRGEPQPASWERALKRGLPWGAGVAVVLVVLAHGPLILGVIYGLAFIPMMYYMDKFVYRTWQRKQAGGKSGKSSGKPGGGKPTGKTG
jgi:hypothetical protein